MWIEKLGAYFLDVSKYILAGVVITSMFKDFDNKIFVYIVGLLLSILCPSGKITVSRFSQPEKAYSLT